MHAIRCAGLSKYFGTVRALDQLDLEVEAGVVFGFIGPNGAGKSTAVKLLTGLSRPSAGKAWVSGEDVILGASSFRAKIGYLPEEPGFYNWMTGDEYLVHIGRLFGLPAMRAKGRADELIDQVGLAEASRRRVGGYSRGMRQRLGLAQALVNEPSVLFLDEPCSALDPIGRKEVLELILRLRGKVTVFMSTHILADVERVCDRVGVIDHGRLVACAGIEELRARNARPAFALRFDGPVDGFVAVLGAQPWVSKVETLPDGDSVLVYAMDAQAARHELPRLAVNSGLTLIRYEVVEPTLEDVFVSLVGEGG